SATAVIVLRNLFAQRFEPLFVAVAAKGFAHAQFVDGAVHRGDDGRRQWLGDVADPAADYALRRLGIRFTELTDPPRDLREKIAGLKLEVVIVKVGQGGKNGVMEYWSVGVMENRSSGPTTPLLHYSIPPPLSNSLRPRPSSPRSTRL